MIFFCIQSKLTSIKTTHNFFHSLFFGTYFLTNINNSFSHLCVMFYVFLMKETFFFFSPTIVGIKLDTAKAVEFLANNSSLPI